MGLLKVRGIFIDQNLGAESRNEDIQRTHIASKAPDAITTEKEVAMLGVDTVDELGTTCFYADKDGNPVHLAYQVKGWIKAAVRALMDRGEAKIPSDVPLGSTTIKRIVMNCVYIYGPRKDDYDVIPLHPSGEMDVCQRPLLGETKGITRSCLASSDALPKGTWIEFYVEYKPNSLHDLMLQVLEFGTDVGLGQWRSSGKGRLYCVIEEDDLYKQIKKQLLNVETGVASYEIVEFNPQPPRERGPKKNMLKIKEMAGR